MKYRRAVAMAILAAANLLNAGTAYAETVCSAIPTSVLVQRDGLVIAEMPWRSNWVGICNVETEWKSIRPGTCWSWFSQIAAAVNDKKTILVYYDQFTIPCDQVATYGASPDPRYVRTIG